MRFLTTPEYESILLAGLTHYGLDETSVRALLASRWPVFGISVVTEAAGRGLSITLGDVQAFLDAMCKENNAEPLDVETTCFQPRMLDLLLAWCCDHERGAPTTTGKLMDERPEQLKVMLQSTKARCN